MSAAAAAPARHPRQVLAVLLLAGLAYALSQTMIVPALPALTDELGASTSAASWLLTGYLLSASVATPLVGKVGDLFGKGRVLTVVLLIFAAGSTICALAPSVEVMIAGRVVQGVAGGVFPLSFGIIRDTFPRDRVAGGIGLLSAVFGIGGGIGLPLAGVIVDHATTSMIFWIGLIAVPAALATHRLVPASPIVERTHIDWAGAAVLSAALVALLYGVTKASSWGWGSPSTIACIAGGLALGAVWIAIERRQAQPLMEMRLLRLRAVAATNLAGLLVGFSMFSSFLLIPQFAQAPESTGYGFGMSVTESGFLLLPSSLVMLVAGPLAGRIGSRFGFRVALMTGTLLASGAFAWLAVEHAAPWHFVASGVLLGGGLAFSFASMANLIVAAVPQSDVGVATGVNTIMRSIGGAVGSGAATALLTAQTIGPSAVPAIGGYTAAFVLSTVVGVLAFVAASLVPRLVGAPSPAPAAA